MRSNDTVLIIGATSSLAQALCRELARCGYGLVLAARDEAELEMLAGDIKTRYGVPCRTVLCDVAEKHFAASHCIGQAGAFDHAVIALGDMGNGHFDDLNNITHVAAINYLLPAQLASIAASRIAQREGGSVTLISSVAGDRGRGSNYLYGSAKAGITAFASGLRNRYAKQGVHVMTVKPGFTDTPMTWGMKSPLIASREAVAKAIVRGMKKKRDVVYAPWFWRFIMLIICAIPERVFKKLSL